MKEYADSPSLRVYFREIARTPPLTPEEEIELVERLKDGDKSAREKMIKANLKLVVKIAKNYSGYGVPINDLISEGNIGLMKAVERFDPNKGSKLSSYSSWWIKNSIKRALSFQGRTIRLPVHMVDIIARTNRVEAMLNEELGRPPPTKKSPMSLACQLKEQSS